MNAVLYKLGGVVFIIGSILFFPRFEAYADLGAWTFFFGSLLYLVVTGHDAIEVWRSRQLTDERGINIQLLGRANDTNPAHGQFTRNNPA